MRCSVPRAAATCLSLSRPVRPLASTVASSLDASPPHRDPVTPHHHPFSRPYHSSSIHDPDPFPPAENAILSAAVAHIPSHGFTAQALLRGAQDAGYPPASLNLFPRGPYDLVNYHLVTQRLALKHTVQFPQSDKPPPVGARVRSLMLARLRANAPLVHKYSEAIALMSLASNIPASLAELARLADEIWYLAGDKAVDTSWYTKRGLLVSVYASAELFMTQDTSKDLVETEQFVDRRLDDVQKLGHTASSVGQWVGFTGQSAVNILRSWGVRL